MGELQWEALRRLLAAAPMAALAEASRGHAGHVALVGGAVRDALLGLAVADLDLVVQEHPEAFRDRVAAAVGRRPVPIGDAFQDTHRMHVNGVQIDIARSLGKLEDDLRRRDFTINAMAVPLPARPFPGGLVDLGGGQEDLRTGVVRMTSPAVLQEDPLRLMRAVRYTATLPGFRLDSETRERVREGVGELGKVARERVQYEWGRILAAPGWSDGVALAHETGLLAATLGRASRLDCVAALAASAPGADVTTRLAAVLMDVGESAPVSARVLGAGRWPRKLARDAVQVAAWAVAGVAAGDEEIAAWALQEPDNVARVAALLEAVPNRDPAVQARTAALRRYARRSREPRWVTGADLLAWGVPAGPELGAGLQRVAVGQLRGRWSDAGECRRWVRARLRSGEPL